MYITLLAFTLCLRFFEFSFAIFFTWPDWKKVLTLNRSSSVGCLAFLPIPDVVVCGFSISNKGWQTDRLSEHAISQFRKI